MVLYFSQARFMMALSAVYDYGPYGVELKNNIKSYWWKSMVQMHENIVGLDAAIFMHPKTWKASGHVDAFNDPLVDNKDSKKRYRADQLIEGYAEKIEAKTLKDIEKAKAKFGDSFEEQKFRETNDRIIERQKQIDAVLDRLAKAMKEQADMDELKAMIDDYEIVCPESGSRNWTEVRQFNLMFNTQLGNIAGERKENYICSPETAQGIFVNFLNVQKSTQPERFLLV
jgi:glycyl-tRNA synthetase